MAQQADVGVVGLAVMGQNLALNMSDRGLSVVVYNRTQAVTDGFLAGPAARSAIAGAATLPELAEKLRTPRLVMLMVQAGAAVDAVLDVLVPLLEPGDVVIDGGNTYFEDTVRRERRLRDHGIGFVGAGVSGGEDGARFGPSIMPGGSAEAWGRARGVLEAVAARADDGAPCCEWLGEDGAGHFVKMVHNGIEYGDMQLIAEAYHLLRDVGRLAPEDMHRTFARWNEGSLESYLIEITRDILATYDDDGRLVLDSILDRAGQKGTGRWTVSAALELGQPLSLVAEAVIARSLSAMKDERERAESILLGPPGDGRAAVASDALVADLEQALYASKVVSYAQGFMMLRAAVRERGWSTDLAAVARVWRAGCIIRSRFLTDIAAAYGARPDLENLMVVPPFADALNAAGPAWRRVVATAVEHGIPTPAFSSALAFYDGYRSGRLPANLIQAQRDYFGAHTYERTDRPRGERFHTRWTGTGGAVTAGAYDA